MNQLIDIPTRIDKTSQTLIDHMYICTSDLTVVNHEVINYNISDHFPILGVFDVRNNTAAPKARHKTITCRRYGATNEEGFIGDLVAAPWGNTDFENCTTDMCLRKFNVTFPNVVHKHASPITKRVQRQVQLMWMSSTLLKSMPKRDTTQKQGRQEDCKCPRNATTALIQDAKSRHYVESIEVCKNNPCKLSNVFQELGHRTSRNSSQTVVNYDGKTSQKDLEIAEVFNKHFTTVVDKQLSIINHKANSQDYTSLTAFVGNRMPPGNIFHLPLVTEDWVRKALSTLPNNNYVHWIRSYLPQNVEVGHSLISHVVTKLCNHSITNNTFPQLWKVA